MTNIVTSRRGLLGMVLAAGMAPSIVRADSLMKIITPCLIARPLGLSIVNVEPGVWVSTYVEDNDVMSSYARTTPISFDLCRTTSKRSLLTFPASFIQ